jgi:predicted Zn-dependent protease with MMP-like domain
MTGSGIEAVASGAAGEDWQQLLDEAFVALSAGQHHDALQLCDRVAVKGDEACYHAAILRGDVLLDLGDPSGALSSYESAADPRWDDAEVDCARGVALFELGQLAEAEKALRSAIRGNPELAEAYYTLGLLAEIAGLGQEVEYFRRARRLDAEQFPQRPFLSRESFEAVIDEAVAGLPAAVRRALDDVPILIAELPHPDDIKFAEPPLPPSALGMYVGPPLHERGAIMDAPDVQQPAMVLFKRTLERSVDERQDLVRQVRWVVMHELGHELGYTDLELDGDFEQSSPS